MYAQTNVQTRIRDNISDPDLEENLVFGWIWMSNIGWHTTQHHGLESWYTDLKFKPK